MTSLLYLKKELQFTVAEFAKLSTEDKETLKKWALEEMKVRGLEVSEK